MSLVIENREVGFKEQGSSAAVAAAAAVLANMPVYLHGGEAAAAGKGEAAHGGRNGFCLGRRAFAEVGGESSDSSSIGVAGESSVSLSSSTVVDDRGDGEEEEEEEVQSKLRNDSLCSLVSLEESLPIKRGLSNFFNGKSKSFACLSEAVTAAASASDLAKPENPFNKRRRILMSAKSSWRRRASCSSLSTAFSTPPPVLPPALHALEESEADKSEEEEDEEEAASATEAPALPPLPPLHRRLTSFRSPRSFSLSDLQQHA